MAAVKMHVVVRDDVVYISAADLATILSAHALALEGREQQGAERVREIVAELLVYALEGLEPELS